MTALRSRFGHALQLVRFNAPLYAIIASALASGLALAAAPVGWPWRAAGASVAAVAAWYGLASFSAFHLMFDRSGLLDGRWLCARPSLPRAPRRWIQLCAALEQTTLPLGELLPDADGQTFDLFARMTQPAVQRARRLAGAQDVLSVDPAALPLGDGSVDLAVVTLAAHELRDEALRAALFRELGRVVRSGSAPGAVVLIEHLRDLPALLAFGPGILHFYPRSEWLRRGREAGLQLTDEFPITPFVRVFVWRVARPFSLDP